MHKQKLFFLITLLVFFISPSIKCQVLQSAEAEKLIKGSKLVRLDPKTRNIRFIQLRDDAKTEDRDQKIWLGKVLKSSPRHSFKEVSRNSDNLGNEHFKYKIFFKNLPVEGEIYNIHTKAGKISSANGDYSPGNDISEKPGLSEVEAFDKIIEYVGALQYRWEKENSHRPIGELVIVPVNEKYVLSYKFDIYAFKPLSRQYIFIDANSGKVIKTLNRIQDENVVGTAETLYNGTVNLTTDSYSGHYRLREKGRGQGIETYDLNEGTDYSTSVDFTDEDNYWDTSTDFDKAAYDAHYGSEATYDYYYQKFNRSSFDNLGAKLKNYVHYSDNYKNAFWNGEYMTYGDGDNVNNLPWTSMEIVAHEITHGVTENSSGLEYKGESGALNESFSDIFGVMVDYYKNPLTANYMNGEAISLIHKPFRDMSNPNVCGHPDTYKGRYWDPNQEVHCNSGVQNFWYYLLCEGGSGTNDIGNSYHVNGIGRDKAIQIAYRNLTVYLTPNSNYDDARFYSIQAAIDLFGGCSSEVTSVGNAWFAVGVGESYDCLDPQNFIAVPVSISQINLNWNKNIDDNNILIAYNTTNNIGKPVDGTSYSQGNSIPGGGLVIYTGNSTSFNHSGLNSGTRYYYKIWSIKQSNKYSGGVSLFAKTHCEAFTLPFSEGFENGDLPDCWAQETGPPSWVFVSGNGSSSTISEAKEGKYNAFLKDLTLSSDRNKLISPPLNITGFTHPVLKFWYAQDSALDFDAQGNKIYPHDERRIYYKSSLIAPWNLLQSYTDQLDLWTETMLSLPDPSNNYYIAFEGDAKDGHGVYIDDIKVFDLNCSTSFVQASDFNVTDITLSSMNLSWTRGNGSEVLVVARQNNPVNANPVNGESYIGNTGFGKGDIIGSGNYVVYRGKGTQVSISDLSPGYDYYFSIFEKSEDRCYAIPALTGKGTTRDCASSSSFPFNEDFEHASFPPPCWIAYRGSNGFGVVCDWIQSDNGYNSNGTAFVDSEILSGELSEDWLVTPRISIPDGPIFSLNYFEDRLGFDDLGDQYYIKISTQSQSDRSTFVDLIKYGGSSFGIGYNQRSIDLSAYAGQSVYIAFVISQNGGNGWYLDNITVDNSHPKTNSTWLGTTSSDWNTRTNWNENNVPTSDDNVVIPSDCSNYPMVDGLAYCNNLSIHDGGSIYLENSANLNVNGDLVISAGSSGFRMVGGNCIVKGDILASYGGSVEILGGGLTFTNWAKKNRGSIHLKGGIINVIKSVYFDFANVLIDGPIVLNIGENYFAGYNIAISDGTINLLGTGISQYFYFISLSSDYPVRANNITVNAPNKTYILSRIHGNSIFLQGNLTLASGTVQTYNGTYNMETFWIAGNLIIEKGATLACGRNTSGGIQVNGNWTNNGGSFIADHTSVDFIGSEQRITGPNTFYKIYKYASSANKLIFGAGVSNRTTIRESLVLSGNVGDLLSLRSETDGKQWEIDVQGTTLLSYLDVKDSKNINAKHINACNLVNSGNNTSWDLTLTNAGSITGTASVCKGSSNINFTVPAIEGVTSYIWTLPKGTQGTSTSNIISISFSDTATSGEIKVKGHNECGDGEESKFFVTVSDIPVRPEITFNTGVLQSNAKTGNQWYLDNQALQNAVNQTLIPQSNGDYFVIVTSGNCASQPSNTIICSSTGLKDDKIDNSINVYPNPTKDAIKVVVNHKFDSEFTVDIYSKMGKLLRSLRKAENEYIFDVDLSDLPAGLYLIRLYNPAINYQIKVIKQ